MQVALSLGWMVFVSWLILRAYRQSHLLPALETTRSMDTETPRVSVIIPARNEGSNLPQCLQALLGQDYPAALLDIILVDDSSADDTLAVASEIACNFSQLSVVEAPALRPGWVGKPHACWVGALQTRPDHEWICFIDADVVAERNLMASAVADARLQGLDLLSLAPRQQLGSFAERLIIPCGLYLMAFCQDLATIQSRATDKVTASGKFMLIRRVVYQSVGGHAAVRNSICEDIALALLIKRAGGQVILKDGKSYLSARMYDGWRSLWTGFSKNVVEMLGGPAATVITALLAVVLSWASILLPAMDGFSCASGKLGGCLALVPALAGTAAVLGLHIAGTFYFRIPLWYGLLFPFGYTVGACLALESLRRHWCGRVIWKGRSYS
jgi:chlorobactene glucosyltransferase